MFYKRENELHDEYIKKLGDVKKKMAEYEKQGITESQRNLYMAALLRESGCMELLDEYKYVHRHNVMKSVVVVLIIICIMSIVSKL